MRAGEKKKTRLEKGQRTEWGKLRRNVMELVLNREGKTTDTFITQTGNTPSKDSSHNNIYTHTHKIISMAFPPFFKIQFQTEMRFKVCRE